MKFNKLLGTFKNGLISPRLRGTVENEREVFNSAEELTNVYVDKIGAINKRNGANALLTFDYDVSYPKISFIFTLMGEQYLFVFDSAITSFSNVDGNYSSVFLKIYSLSDSNYLSQQQVEVFGGRPTANHGTPVVSMWRGQYANNGDFISSGLDDYLSEFDLNWGRKIINYSQPSNRTIVFTTDSFSFTVSLLDYVDSSVSPNQNKKQFYLLPYIVSLPLFVQSSSMSGLPLSAKCPICPSNFPFNDINTDTNLQISFAVLTSGGSDQIGSLPSSGVVSKSNERFVWNMTAPISIGNLVGRFISIPSSDSTKDVVFFITKIDSTGATTYTYRCIQVIGGTPITGGSSSLWKISTWGEYDLSTGYPSAHPQVVGYCFGRLIYANNHTLPTQWWASAVHPDNPYYFQGFLQNRLLQDASSDVSGINYSSKSSFGETDLCRFGFNDDVPNISPIKWVSHRRRIHFGTEEGECQLQVNSGGFGIASYEQLQVGSNSSDLKQVALGDRKIFYIANNLRYIRYISTEDKDYESVDGLLTTLLEGLDLTFRKIAWFESENMLIILTDTYDVYTLSVNSDTEIRAVAKIEVSGNVKDLCTSHNKLYLLVEVDGSLYVSDIPFDSNVFFDFYEIEISPTIGGGSDILTNRLVNIYHNGQTYTDFQTGTAYPIFHTSTGADVLPFDSSTISAENPAYFYLGKIVVRVKSMPFNEGAQYGSAVGDVVRVDRVTFQIDNSGPFKVGESFDNLVEVEGLSSTPSTGLYKVDFPQSPEFENSLCIYSDSPTPLHISGVSLRGVSYSGE